MKTEQVRYSKVRNPTREVEHLVLRRAGFRALIPASTVVLKSKVKMYSYMHFRSKGGVTENGSVHQCLGQPTLGEAPSETAPHRPRIIISDG